MGKGKEFLTVSRKTAGKRNALSRVKDFKEIYIPLNSEEIIKQASRCMDCGVPFCHGYGCTVANLIPEFNEMVFKEKWKEAFEILYSQNPFSDITGKVCPALCEEACVAGESGDAVTIKQIELAVMEKAYEKGFLKPNPPKLRNNKKIAVIGSGPAGLAAAYALNKKGFTVTVYERNKMPGGMLYYGIPDFKLDKNYLLRRINLLKEEGVRFETETAIGRDISFSYLNRNFNAVVIAAGAWTPRDVAAEGRNLKGVHFAMEFLSQRVKINNKENFNEEKIDAAGKTVVVLGGGDTGADCASTALRLGAKKVYQVEILPCPPKERPANQPWPDYPFILRPSSADEEGAERLWAFSACKFQGERGRLSGIQLSAVEWKNKDGKMTFKETSRVKKIKCGLVLIAAGFTGASDYEIFRNSGIALKNNFIIQQEGLTSKKNIYAAGDASIGPSLVVRALSSGFKAAEKIISDFGF